ncbi:MAG: S-layer homology domain-containing protein [Clostridia bacterium]|nr:S-layer homology domain-containing protein [Clostridia bacterium]
MKKVITVILLLALSLSALGVSSLAYFGTGVEAMASEVTMIKAGLFGKKLCFSDTDFKSALCITSFNRVTITELPASNEGTLMLAGCRVREGQSIKRKNVAALVFIPASSEVAEADFSFKVDECGGGAVYKCIMKFTDKINYAPEAPETNAASLSVSTQSEVTLHGRLYATDPEGDALEYIIVSYPKNGILTLTDRAAGRYKYTPVGDYTGEDKFVYVARDEWGNYSEPVRVSVKTTERMSSLVYADMTDREEYNAAIAMSALGVMSGRTLGDATYFMPEESVTRAEFVAMAMKAAGLAADTSLGGSYFDDNADIPAPLVSYVATAARLGIIDGSFSDGGLTFSPNRAITRYEAASIMAKILGLSEESEESVFGELDEVPVWARGGVYAMCTLGIFDPEISTESAVGTVSRANAAEYLYRMIRK